MAGAGCTLTETVDGDHHVEVGLVAPDKVRAKLRVELRGNRSRDRPGKHRVETPEDLRNAVSHEATSAAAQSSCQARFRAGRYSNRPTTLMGVEAALCELDKRQVGEDHAREDQE